MVRERVIARLMADCGSLCRALLRRFGRGVGFGFPADEEIRVRGDLLLDHSVKGQGEGSGWPREGSGW